ncbi:unnamed protein product [Didymodactylos carnosus]|uniref:Uncharacterized protein n=1 Tax=Didymodactylos carnosus TaxID=1234261 RepID=A0A813UA51_9BILA|nr:unnamed protein product [Didymodactylos carnosus]CAF0882937.1 unnamed protein product [Didymodactylos carnosus]CAF3612780.1 unnamed protein product [Didymodactylos carnosus]CAF3666412.1 unnamed protein product [Didymodactylos carnosus]
MTATNFARVFEYALANANILSEIQKANLLLQRSYTTAANVDQQKTNLIRKLNTLLNDIFYGYKTKQLLKKQSLKSLELDKLNNHLLIQQLNISKDIMTNVLSCYKSLSIYDGNDDGNDVTKIE